MGGSRGSGSNNADHSQHQKIGRSNKMQQQQNYVNQSSEFSLHSSDDSSIKKIIDFVDTNSLNRLRTCVVSIISKGSLDQSMKTHLVQAMLDKGSNKVQLSESFRENLSLEADIGHSLENNPNLSTEIKKQHNRQILEERNNQITGNIDYNNGLIVLNLSSVLEADVLCSMSESLMNGKRTVSDDSTAGFTDLWPNHNLMKALLILINMSHIIVFYQPEPSLDYNFIPIFKMLETLRNRAQSRISDLLETIGSTQIFSQQWIRQSRLCCPRALFLCDTSYIDNEVEKVDLVSMRQELEDQIYLVLKKTNIIPRPVVGHGPQQSLFSLPERDNFVYILTGKDSSAFGIDRQSRSREEIESVRWFDDLFRSLDLNLYKMIESGNTELVTGRNNEDDARITDYSRFKSRRYSRFWKFLNRHIADIQAQAYSEQDNRNTFNKQTVITYMPRLDDFLAVLLKLKTLLYPQRQLSDEDATCASLSIPNCSAKDERRFLDIHDLLNNDELFSERHCQKVRLAAFELYSRGIQLALNNESSHKNSLDSAKRLYLNHARGSARYSNLDLLIEQCNRYWLDQNQKVWQQERGANRPDSRSRANRNVLTSSSPVAIGRTNSETSKTSPQQSTKSKSDIALKRRPNGVKVIASCECGRESSLLITPVDRKRKLERIDVQQIND